MEDITTRLFKKICRNTTNHYFKQKYLVEVEAGFNRRSIILGKSLIERGRNNTIDMVEASRVILLAKTRSGKTFLTRRAIDYIYQAGGYSIAILPDAKDEIKSSLYPIQSEFQEMLRVGEKPHQLPLRIFRPVFFNKVDRGVLPDDNEYCSIELSDLSQPDFNDLFGFDSMTEKQKVISDKIWSYIEKGKMTTIEKILEYTESLLPKITIHDRFLNIYNQKIFSSTHNIDPVDIIRGGDIPVLNYDKYTKLNTKSNGILQVFLSIWLRKLINARQNNDIKPLWIFMDETARWCPSGSNPCCKEVILDSIDVDTGYNISYWFATQREESIPQDLIRQCKHVLISSTTDVKLLEYGLKASLLIRDKAKDSQKFSYIFKTLKKHEYSWLNINSNNATFDIMIPYSPMSNHMKTRS